MKDKRCAPVRRELEELTLHEDFSTAAGEHLKTCSDCREFRRQQTKLRQIVGSLGTVSAPADFDFRLRARLAADSEAPGFRFWSVTVKGLATAAVLVVFGAGSMIVWQRTHEQSAAVAEAPPQAAEPVRREEPNSEASSAAHAPQTVPVIAVSSPRRPKPERSPVVTRPRRNISTLEFSSERANVVNNTRPAVNTTAVFPIEASSPALKLSFDDGSGNARTISFPSVSFGSQRVLTNTNQFAPKGVW